MFRKLGVVVVVILGMNLAQAKADCRTQKDIPEVECEVLVKFYNNTSSLDWNLANSPCQWSGVQCSDGHVVSLQLVHKQLTGTIPSEIGQLTQLQQLDLTNNQLEGELPEEIGQLAQLTVLELTDNQLNGEIPQAIGQLTQLQYLDISENQLVGEIPLEINLLTKLEFLILYDNQLAGKIPSEIGQLIKLKALILNNNQLVGEIPPGISQLSELQNLELKYNGLCGNIPSSLASLTTLEHLSLEYNYLNTTVSEAQLIEVLNRLNFLWTNQVPGDCQAQQAPQFPSFTIDLLKIPVVNVPDIGMSFKVQLRLLDVFAWEFVLWEREPELTSIATGPLTANFSLEDGNLHIPNVKIIEDFFPGKIIRHYRVGMKLISGENESMMRFQITEFSLISSDESHRLE